MVKSSSKRWHKNSFFYFGAFIWMMMFGFSFYTQISLLKDQHTSKMDKLHYSENSNNKQITKEKFASRLIGPIEGSDPKLVEELRNNYLVPPSNLGYNLSTDPNYLSESHSFQWKFIRDTLEVLFSSEDSGGFFVEAGALDGEFFSNSLWLEQQLHWSGLLIEPEPSNYNEMVLKRRKAWISHSCLSTTPYPKQIDLVPAKLGKNVMYSRGGAHEKGISPEGREIKTPEDEATRSFKCQCFPLETYLAALNISQIDVLSLDLQGSELEVFDTIPLNKIKIRVLVIENEYLGFNYKLVKHLNAKGFDILVVGGSPDYIFVAKNDPVWKNYKKVPMQRMVDTNSPIKFVVD